MCHFPTGIRGPCLSYEIDSDHHSTGNSYRPVGYKPARHCLVEKGLIIFHFQPAYENEFSVFVFVFQLELCGNEQESSVLLTRAYMCRLQLKQSSVESIVC